MAVKPLVLTVQATTDEMKRSLRDARATLADFGKSAEDVLREIQDNWNSRSALVGDDLAKRMGQQMTDQFRAIQRSAEQAVAMGGKFDPSGGFNADSSLKAAAGYEQAAIAAQQRAQAILRVVTAEEAAGVVDEQRIATLRTMMAASQEAAMALDEQAAAMRTQAGVLAALEAEEANMGVVTQQSADVVVAGHSRMSVSSQMLMHSVRATTDSFAAGAPVTMIITEQLGRLADAAAFAAAETGATEGVAARFAAFMTSGWGLAIVGGVTVVGALISHLGLLDGALGESEKEMKDVKLASDGLGEAQNVLGQMFDLATGKIKDQNSMLRLNAELLAINLRAQAAAKESSSQSAFAGAGSGHTSTMDQIIATVTFAPMSHDKDTYGRAQALKGMVDQYRGGSLSAIDLAKRAENFNFSGLNVDRTGFLQAIADQATARGNRETADKIESSLNNNHLDPAFIRPERASRGRKGSGVDQAERNQEALDQAMDAAKSDRARIEREGVTDAEQLAQLDKQALRDGLQQKLDRNRKLKLDHQQLDDYETASEQIAEAKIDARTEKTLTDQRLDRMRDALQQQSQLLELQGQLAPTLKERLSIALQINEIERQVALNEAAKAQNDHPEAQSAYDAKVAGINARFDAQGAVTRRQNESPLQAYARNLDQADIATQTEGLVVDELNSVRDAIHSAIERVTGTKDPLINGLLMMLVDQLVLKPLANTLAQASSSVAGSGSGLLGGLLGFLHLADGGSVSGPGGPRDDRIPAMLSAGEFVVNAAATRKHGRLLQAINDGSIVHLADGGAVDISNISYPTIPSVAALRAGGQPQQVVVLVQANDFFEAKVHSIAAQHATVALASAPALTQSEISDQQMQRIPT